jgi:hypothetical protein
MDFLQNRVEFFETPGFQETKALCIPESDLNNSAPTLEQLGTPKKINPSPPHTQIKTQALPTACVAGSGTACKFNT